MLTNEKRAAATPKSRGNMQLFFTLDTPSNDVKHSCPSIPSFECLITRRRKALRTVFCIFPPCASLLPKSDHFDPRTDSLTGICLFAAARLQCCLPEWICDRSEQIGLLFCGVFQRRLIAWAQATKPFLHRRDSTLTALSWPRPFHRSITSLPAFALARLGSSGSFLRRPRSC